MRKNLTILMMIFGLTLAGCATLYDSMGLATKDSLTTRDQRLQALEGQSSDLVAKVNDLEAKMGQLTSTEDRVAAVEALMKSLEGKVNQLPQATLRKLADVLAKAATEAATEAASPAAP